MNPDRPTEYAGFWRRGAAWFLDLLFLTPITVVVLHLVYGRAYWRWLSSDEVTLFYGFWDPVVNYGLPLAFVVGLWAWIGATPGKWVMGCRVLDMRTGHFPSPGRALLRFAAYLASYLPLGLGFFWAAWDRRKQGFHDKIAGTIVVREQHVLPTMDEIRRRLG